jgi:hypothetical protein
MKGIDRAGRMQDHVAFVREFDRIAEQVHDDLAQPSRIAAHQDRHRTVDVHDQFDAFHG